MFGETENQEILYSGLSESFDKKHNVVIGEIKYQKLLDNCNFSNLALATIL